MLTKNGCVQDQHEARSFVSKYVLRKLANMCDDKQQFLARCYREADNTNNPAFRGWVFEFDVDFQLTSAPTPHMFGHELGLLQETVGHTRSW